MQNMKAGLKEDWREFRQIGQRVTTSRLIFCNEILPGEGAGKDISVVLVYGGCPPR